MEEKERIGVFDSGLGGISVLRELVARMPKEDYLYYGDSANAPYGERPEEEIAKLTFASIAKMAEEPLKAIVIACNTATSAAVNGLRKAYPTIPIIGIEPALKPAILNKENPTVVVMATHATLRQEKFMQLMNEYEGYGTILKLPCPKLVEFVERGELHSIALTNYIKERFASIQEELGQKKVDSVVLGCTHFPFVREAIAKVVGRKAILFDGAIGTAKQLERKLKAIGKLRLTGDKGNILWQNSTEDPVYIERSKMLYALPEK